MGIVTNRYTGSDGGGSTSTFNLTIQELDGVPTVSGVTTIRVSNGTLIDNGGGVVTLTTGGGGGTLTVSDGVTAVGGVVNLTFTSGATVTSGGVGIANVLLFLVGERLEVRFLLLKYLMERLLTPLEGILISLTMILLILFQFLTLILELEAHIN
jgi:hypothetical protein